MLYLLPLRAGDWDSSWKILVVRSLSVTPNRSKASRALNSSALEPVRREASR